VKAENPGGECAMSLSVSFFLRSEDLRRTFESLEEKVRIARKVEYF
jgi:hypothetical protein